MVKERQKPVSFLLSVEVNTHHNKEQQRQNMSDVNQIFVKHFQITFTINTILMKRGQVIQINLPYAPSKKRKRIQSLYS